MDGASGYTFDAAGRLTVAAIPGHTLTYGFGDTPSGACVAGNSPVAGKNGNRTTTTDTPAGGGGLAYTTNYCYDSTDRLLSAAEAVTGAGSAPAGMVRAAKSVPAASISYDAHGNVTRLGDQMFTYDAAGRHKSTTVLDGPSGAAGTKVDYARDPAGNVVSRTESPLVGPPTVFRYTGPFVLTGSTPTQRTLSLPGGVTVSIPITGDPVADAAARKWAYPNIHGDNTWTADNTGARTGVFLYDPFGQPLDVANKVIGSATADDTVPDTMPGSYDTGWVGSNGKGYEHLGSIAIIEMGVRMYSPMLGRFLAADPVAGGNTAWYNYPNDPINMFDLDGRRALGPYDNHWGYNEGANRPSTGTVQAKAGTTPGGPNWRGKDAALNESRPHFTPIQVRDNWKATASALSWISAGAGFVSLFPIPYAQPIAAGIGLLTGTASTLISCQIDTQSKDCRLGLVGMAFGGLGSLGRKVFEVSVWAFGVPPLFVPDQW